MSGSDNWFSDQEREFPLNDLLGSNPLPDDAWITAAMV